MSGPWMAEVADLVDAANVAAAQTAQTGVQAPLVSKATPPTMAVPIPVDDTPTEPATSPRMIERIANRTSTSNRRDWSS